MRAEPLAQLDTSREVLLVWTHGHEKPAPGLEQPVEMPAQEPSEAGVGDEANEETPEGEVVEETPDDGE